jgi:hypothetical protein
MKVMEFSVLVTILLVVLVSILMLLYLLRNKIFIVGNFMLSFLFPIMLVLTLTAILFAGPFEFIAKSVLDVYGVTEQVKQADQPLKAVSEGIIGEIGKIFNPNSETPQTPVADQDQGLFRRLIYDPLVGIISGTLRAFTLLIGIMGMLLAFYLKMSISSVAEVAKLKSRLAELEKKLP